MCFDLICLELTRIDRHGGSRLMGIGRLNVQTHLNINKAKALSIDSGRRRQFVKSLDASDSAFLVKG